MRPAESAGRSGATQSSEPAQEARARQGQRSRFWHGCADQIKRMLIEAATVVRSVAGIAAIAEDLEVVFKSGWSTARIRRWIPVVQHQMQWHAARDTEESAPQS